MLPAEKPCLQLLPALPNHPKLGGNFVQMDCSLQLNFWGKFQLKTMALSKNEEKGKNKGFVLILKFCL